ncbi:ABC transporter transmembrane domain-containing protein [Motiliproteus sediminis]|uniref:ABC transporter transmembrane domain-containing protein n=1 Tax=Motiliproteus sediminis TaxID=1468178 RepID=UPI001AF0241B|nr:ABC transporter ATP-binding protein [Motiliproteus sediminis]
MESSIFKFILKYTLRDQIWILLLTLVSFPFVYATLEVPKMIINDAIGGANIPQQVFGYPVDQISYLGLLCAVFLALVLINGAIKYVLNVYRGIVGERTLRRLRYRLYDAILRFPAPRFKKISQGEVIPIITAETESLGGFVGEAFALPAFQGGLLLTYLFFIFNQDPLLGAAAVALYPLQMYLIPKLQRQVNKLNKKRVLQVRKLGDRIGDSMAGVREVHTNDTSHFERAVISQRLGKIFVIRMEIFRKKFFIKFLNNFLAQVTPFFFYLIGGYFVIKGELSLGALVAVLAAYKDLDAPWKELLRYYQAKESARIKYDQIIERFEVDGMLNADLQQGPVLRLELDKSGWQGHWVGYAEEEGVQLLERLSFTLAANAHVAVVGRGPSGVEAFGQLLARLVMPTSGKLTLAGADLRQLPESALGQHIGYVGAGAHLFSGSILYNLLYPLRHRFNQQQDDETARAKEILFSRQSGNSTADPDGVWIEPDALQLEGDEALNDHIHWALHQADLDDDLFQLGLQADLAEAASDALKQRMLDARARIRERLEEDSFRGLVEPFDWNRYNTNLSVHENILFGSTRARPDGEEAAQNPLARQFLRDQGLLEDFLRIGRQLTETMVDLFSDVEESSDLFERFSFIRAEELPEYRALLKRTSSEAIDIDDEEATQKFLSLTFMLCPARHRLGLIDAGMQQRILRARHAFAELYRNQGTQIEIEFFEQQQFNSGLSLLDNLLFGKLAYGQARANERVTGLIHDVIHELGLERDVRDAGLRFEVGTAGSRLSLPQRQKLAIARALIKKPDVVILNEGTSGLDPTTERRVLERLRQSQQGRGLVVITGRPELVQDFAQLMFFERGQLVAEGPYDELMDKEAGFRALAG